MLVAWVQIPLPNESTRRSIFIKKFARLDAELKHQIGVHEAVPREWLKGDQIYETTLDLGDSQAPRVKELASTCNITEV
jgi:hypothetical protein